MPCRNMAACALTPYEQSRPLWSLLEKLGFTLCGTILVLDSPPAGLSEMPLRLYSFSTIR